MQQTNNQSSEPPSLRGALSHIIAMRSAGVRPPLMKPHQTTGQMRELRRRFNEKTALKAVKLRPGEIEDQPTVKMASLPTLEERTSGLLPAITRPRLPIDFSTGKAYAKLQDSDISTEDAIAKAVKHYRYFERILPKEAVYLHAIRYAKHPSRRHDIDFWNSIPIVNAGYVEYDVKVV